MNIVRNLSGSQRVLGPGARQTSILSIAFEISHLSASYLKNKLLERLTDIREHEPSNYYRRYEGMEIGEPHICLRDFGLVDQYTWYRAWLCLTAIRDKIER